jgi:hypothetical protein
MLAYLIFILINKYCKEHVIRFTSKFGKSILLLVFLLLLLVVAVAAQERKLQYSVKKGNNIVGYMTILLKDSQNTNVIKLYSDVNVRFIIKIALKDVEESIFKEGYLVSSNLYREVNGNEKANKKHNVFSAGYIVESKNRRDTVYCSRISYNLMSMYRAEPVTIKQVYSENFEKFLAIEKVGVHTYRLQLPDGNYQKYFYKGGICVKVELHNSFYMVTMELK